MKEDFIGQDAMAFAERTATRAYKVLETAVEVLESAVGAARASAKPDETGVIKEVKVVNTALLHALQMQGKAHDAGSQMFGRLGGTELDLEAARAEIGLRLACLRAAGGGG